MATPTGKFVWYEYMGNDLKAAADFYTHVVGWTAKGRRDGRASPMRSSRPATIWSPG